MLTISLYAILELGLIYALVTLAVYLTFRVVNFPDLTVEGSFPLGAAVAAVLLTHGMHPLLATGVAMAAGCIAGCVTGYLHVHLRILGLLASILTMSALYSVNIRVMGKPNISLLNSDTLFHHYSPLFIMLIIVTLVVFILNRFLASEYGLALRTVGLNPTISRSYGVHCGKATLFTLALSNGLVALAGALFAQTQGFADVSLGVGVIVTGLASLMIGEAFLGGRRVILDLAACVVGSILYRTAIAFALNSQEIGLQPSDLNLITAVVVVLALVTPGIKRGLK